MLLLTPELAFQSLQLGNLSNSAQACRLMVMMAHLVLCCIANPL